MDNYINNLIEKTVDKPMTRYQIELIKIGIIATLSLILAIAFIVGFSMNIVEIDMTIIAYYSVFILLCPLGFYYGWRTIFKLLKGKITDSTETGIIAALFTGSGWWGYIIGFLLLALTIVFSLIIGWIIGYIKMFKKLNHLKKIEQDS